MTDHELKRMLMLTDPEELRALYEKAYQVKLHYIGKKVSIRGLIEISNICSKNCYYCGIRSGNPNVKRFRLSKERSLKTALWSKRHGFCLAGDSGREIRRRRSRISSKRFWSELTRRTDHGSASRSLWENRRGDLPALRNAEPRGICSD